APPRGVVRPVRERQHARRVRPVLERRGPGRVPVRPLDLVPPDRAEPRVRHQLVRPCEHADRVKLHRRDPPQHPGDAPPPPLRAPRPARAATPPRAPAAPRPPGEKGPSPRPGPAGGWGSPRGGVCTSPRPAAVFSPPRQTRAGGSNNPGGGGGLPPHARGLRG